MTPEQHREYARQVITTAPRASIEESLRNIQPDSDTWRDLLATLDLIRAAKLTITWPDPCPACGVVGCTEHPTWAADSTPEQHYRKVFRMGERTVDTAAGEANLYAFEPVECAETPATTNTLVAGWPEPIAVEYEHLGLTPAQEIRLRLVEMFRSPTDDESTEDYVRNLLLCVSPLAVYVDTGLVPKAEVVDLGQPVFMPAGARLIERGRAGYSQTVPGFPSVVTAQDPGGLLSEPEAPVAPLPVATSNDTPGA